MEDTRNTEAGRTLALPPREQLAYLGAAAIGLVLLLFGLPFLVRLFTPPPPPAPPAPPPGAFVATEGQWATLKFATVTMVPLRSQTETDGKIATDDDHTTQVFSPYSGRVVRVMARAGDRVRAGQPLFAVQASELAQGQDDLATAEAQLKLTQAAEARQEALVKANGAAVKDLQQSQADLATATANLQAVRDRLRILGASDAQVVALEHAGPERGGGAEAVVASPISGVVTQRAIGVGQNIGSVATGATTAAFTVSDVSTVWLVGELREADAPKAQVGQPVEVRVTALPGRVFDAKLDFVSPTSDPVTHRVAVRATLANPDGVLKPEMFASFTLITGGAEAAVAAPEEAVIYEGDTARVWVAHGGRALELRQIQAGRAVDGMVEVLSGLRPGERVVTSGSLFIDRASLGD